MDITVFFYIIITHWLADFVLQTDEMAKYKSTSNKWLFRHVLTYVFVLNIVGVLIFQNNTLDICIFSGITFIFHFITDFFTSKINSNFRRQNRNHAFFVALGFDQVLHYIQLILTFYYIVK